MKKKEIKYFGGYGGRKVTTVGNWRLEGCVLWYYT